MDEIVLVKYQDNFADNFTAYAYSKIIEKNLGTKCCWENNSKARNDFENKMSCFSMDCDYISSARVQKIANRANNLNKIYLNKRKNKIIDKKLFNLDDCRFLTDEIINDFRFENLDFLQNFDVLEKIKTRNSVGLFVSSFDIDSQMIDIDYISRATKRLNKYLKKPKLFIFCDKNKSFEFDSQIDYEFIFQEDYKEGFYMLKSCRHKIILNCQNSYSQALWAAMLNESPFGYCVFDKKLKTKYKKERWLFV